MLRCWKHNPWPGQLQFELLRRASPTLFALMGCLVCRSGRCHVTFTFSLFHHTEKSVTRFTYMLKSLRCIAINTGPPYVSVNCHELIQISRNIEQLDDIQQTHLLPLFQPRIRSCMNQILVQNFFLSLYL
jgi:hypothetical protein